MRMQVIDRVVLGDLIVDSNVTFVVVATKHQDNWPGTKSDTTFAVEKSVRGRTVAAWGFFTEQEAWDFLTNDGKATYNAFDTQGNDNEETRERLGYGDGRVRRFRPDIKTKRGTPPEQVDA